MNTTTTAYDTLGDASATIDPLGRVTAESYDSLGQDVAGYRGKYSPAAARRSRTFRKTARCPTTFTSTGRRT